jgi:hypothetical protein
VLVGQELLDTNPVDLALFWPGDPGVLRLSVDVSRTWTPSQYGSTDSRELGAGLITEHVDGLDQAGDGRAIELESCGGAAAP